jgi:hypothetical protein
MMGIDSNLIELWNYRKSESALEGSQAQWPRSANGRAHVPAPAA